MPLRASLQIGSLSGCEAVSGTFARPHGRASAEDLRVPGGHPMPDHAPARREMTLPAAAWMAVFGAGLLLVLLVIGIALQLATLEDSRNHIVAQDAKITTLLKGSRAAAEATEPLLSDAKPLLSDAKPLVRDARRALGPLGDSASSLATSTERLPSLIRAFAALTDLAVPVLQDVGRADIAGSIDALDAMIAQVRSEDLIRLSARAARDAPRVVRLQRRLLRVQLETLETQKASLETQRTTLEVQRQALAAVQSIDRKTGGRFPPTGTATDAAPATP